MQIFAKFKKIPRRGFRATLNFRKSSWADFTWTTFFFIMGVVQAIPSDWKTIIRSSLCDNEISPIPHTPYMQSPNCTFCNEEPEFLEHLLFRCWFWILERRPVLFKENNIVIRHRILKEKEDSFIINRVLP